jgi:hypothetical protein
MYKPAQHKGEFGRVASPNNSCAAERFGEEKQLRSWDGLSNCSTSPTRLYPLILGLLVSNLRILQTTVGELISSAKLRPQTEIDDYCAFCLIVRHQAQLSVLGEDAQATLSRIDESRLTEMDLNKAIHRLKGVEVEATTLASTVASVKGLYIVRAMTAEWLLGKND